MELEEKKKKDSDIWYYLIFDIIWYYLIYLILLIFDIIIPWARLCDKHFTGSIPFNPHSFRWDEVGNVITISQRRKLRHNEVKKLAPNHTARKWQDHTMIHFFLDPELVLITLGYIVSPGYETLSLDVYFKVTFWNFNTVLKSQQ